MAAEYFARVDDATGEIFEFGDASLGGAAAGQSIVSVGILPFMPDRRTKRYNGAGGVRDATAQEVTDFDTAKQDREAIHDIDGAKALRALVLWLAQKLAVPPAQARSEIIAKYKGLP